MLPVLDGYISYQTKRNCSQKSGIVIYIKPNLTHSVTEPLISEANRLVCSLPSNDMVIIVVYRSPSFRKVDEFLSSLYVILTKFSNISNTLTLDINIHINNQFRLRRSRIFNTGLYPSHMLPTREINFST